MSLLNVSHAGNKHCNMKEVGKNNSILKANFVIMKLQSAKYVLICSHNNNYKKNGKAQI